MPELPEVQTIVSDLNKKIKGDIITGFWSDWPRAIKGKSLQEFTEEILNRKILHARRQGKNIIIDLSGGKALYIHLKMTGHLLVKSKKASPEAEKYFNEKVNSYIHHVWHLGKDKDKTLEFSDVRKFAKIILDDREKIENLPELKKLGVDALSPQLTAKKLKELLNKRKNKPIGTVLMEQEIIAGIGNIYRSEILFEAGIHPSRVVKKLQEEEINKIYTAIRKTLKKAIKLRGTSDSDYRDTAGAPGQYQKVMLVYRRAGQSCPRCGNIIKRKVQNQRSVFFCSRCQK